MTKPQIDVKGGPGMGREPEVRVSIPGDSTSAFERSRPRPTGRIVATQAVRVEEINLIDINELARRLSIPKGTLYNWVYLRRIPFVNLAGRFASTRRRSSELCVRLLHWKWLAGGRRSKQWPSTNEAGFGMQTITPTVNELQESTGTANKREAEKFLALRISEVQRGVFVKPVNTTLPELGERYIEYAKLHKRSWKRDVQMLGNLHAFFGPAKLRDITPLRVEEYQRERVREVSPATSNREMALLKHMFNMAERWGQHQGTNPVRLVRFLPEDNLRCRDVQ